MRNTSVRSDQTRTTARGRHTRGHDPHGHRPQIGGSSGCGSPGHPGRAPECDVDLPLLLTPLEVAELLRTTRAAIYSMTARAQLPGVTRIGGRLLFRSVDLLSWLNQKRAPSPQEGWR